jgi:prevent-host-death family protein
MKKASITQAKNGLSALLDHVRHGHTVIIEDRGIPIARISPLAGSSEGRAARLTRQGLVRAPRKKLTEAFFRTPPPRPPKGRGGSAIVIEERSESR